MLRYVLLGLGIFAAIISLLIFSGRIPVGKTGTEPKGEVVLWGTIPETQMNVVIQQFNPQARTYTVSYREIPASQFDQRLLEALANGTGPDLVIAPHQTILANATRFYTFPLASFSEKNYKDTYVDAGSLFFTPQGAIALPVTIDPLVLFYNRALFSKQGIISAPQYWDELVSIAPRLTVQGQNGQFVESAISLGAPNTPYMKDILMAVVGQLRQTPLLVQYGEKGPLVSVTANNSLTEGGDVFPLSTAVRFFTQFSDTTKDTYTWSQYGGNAQDQFVAERVAMYIGYASELSTLRARNQKADFEMAYLPQTRGYNTFVTGGQMYGIAALKATANPVTALTVQSQFAGVGIAPSLARMIGATPALRSYSATQGLSDVIARSMLIARPWYDSFPVQSGNLVASMFSDILSGRMLPSDAVSLFVSRLQDLYTPL